MNCFRPTAEFSQFGRILLILGADAGQGSKQGPKEESKAAVTPIRAVGEPGVDEEDRLAQAARAPEKIRPDLGFDQNDGFRTNDTESASDNAALVDGVIDLADVIGELALELRHSSGGGGGNDDFQVWHARFERTDELSANVHLTDANGMRPKDMPVGDGLFEFRVVLGEPLAEVLFPITAPPHTH